MTLQPWIHLVSQLICMIGLMIGGMELAIQRIGFATLADWQLVVSQNIQLGLYAAAPFPERTSNTIGKSFQLSGPNNR